MCEYVKVGVVEQVFACFECTTALEGLIAATQAIDPLLHTY